MNFSEKGAHIPWARVEEYLDLVLDMNLVPEFAIKGPELDALDPRTVQGIAEKLDEKAIRPKVHAPFFDLNPGALDPVIRTATHQRLSQTINFAGQINTSLIVLHPGVDKWRYPNLSQAWLDNALAFFPALITQAIERDCRLAIENIYEEAPDDLVKLVDGLDSAWFGHCFDAGHWHLFGRRPMAEWLEAISAKLFHLHLHDNHGRADEHLPVGSGTIDFKPLQEHLRQRTTLPSMTLEAHSAEHLQQSLRNVQSLFS